MLTVSDIRSHSGRTDLSELHFRWAGLAVHVTLPLLRTTPFRTRSPRPAACEPHTASSDSTHGNARNQSSAPAPGRLHLRLRLDADCRQRLFLDRLQDRISTPMTTHQVQHVRRLDGSCRQDCPACSLGIEDSLSVRIMGAYESFRAHLPSGLSKDQHSALYAEFFRVMAEATRWA